MGPKERALAIPGHFAKAAVTSPPLKHAFDVRLQLYCFFSKSWSVNPLPPVWQYLVGGLLSLAFVQPFPRGEPFCFYEQIHGVEYTY